MSRIEAGIHASVWRKARRSISNGECVEVAAARHEVLVRDSKNPSGATLGYPAGSWLTFVSSAKRGDFDVLKLRASTRGKGRPHGRCADSALYGL